MFLAYICVAASCGLGTDLHRWPGISLPGFCGSHIRCHGDVINPPPPPPQIKFLELFERDNFGATLRSSICVAEAADGVVWECWPRGGLLRPVQGSLWLISGLLVGMWPFTACPCLPKPNNHSKTGLDVRGAVLLCPLLTESMYFLRPHLLHTSRPLL